MKIVNSAAFRNAIRLRRLLVDPRGAISIEYALIASAIGAAIAATVFSLGSLVKSSLYDKIAAAFF